MEPETRYARSGDAHIAYQVVGDSPIDLVVVPGFYSNVEFWREEPSVVRFLDRLASFSRLIVFDARGCGLSDRAPELPALEQQMDDVLAVLDAVHSESAVFFGLSQGGPMAILFAATHPGRTSGLVLYGTYPVARSDDDYPWGRSPAWLEENLQNIAERWGTGQNLPFMAPSKAQDELFRRWWCRFERFTNGPGNALANTRMNTEIDVRAVLPTIRVPTLVLQRRDDIFRDPGNARYIAAHIPDAKLVELPGVDHLPYVGDTDAILDEVQEFVTGVRPPPEPDRVLATVLFTDIVDSTERASRLGDRGWKDLLERHHILVRRQLARFRGREVDTTGDGFLATFDGPARAILCAEAIVEAVRGIGVEVRAGVHTGEVELIGDRVGGIAVHIGARIAAMTGPGEVLVSSTVKDLVAGSGIAFEDRGSHALRGVPGEWRLFSVRRA